MRNCAQGHASSTTGATRGPRSARCGSDLRRQTNAGRLKRDQSRENLRALFFARFESSPDMEKTAAWELDFSSPWR